MRACARRAQDSDLAGLLSLAQREAVADVVNAALLATRAQPAPGLAHRHASGERAGQVRRRACRARACCPPRHGPGALTDAPGRGVCVCVACSGA